jgi:flagellar biosynthesis/type III secretory pathway M-ring protein FliF/YscJ
VAEQKKLARILSGMNGIETASVQYAEVKKPGFPPTSDIRAVVAVRANGNRELTYEEIEAIRDTVAGFVAGLDRSQVTISDLNACRAYPGGGGLGAAGANYAARIEQARLEGEFRTKIRSRLTAYPGLIVGVNVQVAEPAGTTVADAAPAEHRRFVPALVSASIDLPKSYFLQVWRERHPDGTPPDRQTLQATEDEIKRTVEQAVLALLPSPAAGLRGSPQVVVTSYADLPTAAGTGTTGLPSLATAWRAAPWLLLASSLLFASGVLVIRARRRPAAVEDGPGRASTAEVTEGSTSVAFASSAAKPAGAGPEVRVAIHRAVQENPQAAAEALQRWLRKAA